VILKAAAVSGLCVSLREEHLNRLVRIPSLRACLRAALQLSSGNVFASVIVLCAALLTAYTLVVTVSGAGYPLVAVKLNRLVQSRVPTARSRDALRR